MDIDLIVEEKDGSVHVLDYRREKESFSYKGVKLPSHFSLNVKDYLPLVKKMRVKFGKRAKVVIRIRFGSGDRFDVYL